MAKKSAHGRVEIAVAVLDGLPDHEGTVTKTTRALMSDGVVLTKSSFTRADGTRHASGWKTHSKLRPGRTAADWIAAYRRMNWAVQITKEER